jgi:phage/plasmid-associated DNA primase
MTQPFDQSIPVLTEVFADVPFKKPAAPEPDADAIGAELEAMATDSWTEPEWKLLEERVAGRILAQLDARIDATLDNQLRDSLADVLQFAMATLSDQLRAGLQQAIEQTVSRAVAQELAHLQNLHRK